MRFVATCVDKPHRLDKDYEIPAYLVGLFVGVSVKPWRYAIGQNFA